MKINRIVLFCSPARHHQAIVGILLSVVLATIFLSSTASALLMTDTGPERIIVQIKDSIRQSEQFDAALLSLALLETQEGMKIEKRWVAEKYLELLSFPQTFTEQQALAVISKLELSPSVEKVVAVSAFNLEFIPGDFARAFGPTDFIPEPARRGLDAAYYANSPNTPVSQVIAPHVPGQFIARWKDEYVWKAEQTGFDAQMAVFNATAGVQVLYNLYSSAHELVQVMGFDPTNVSLEEELNRYNGCPWVVYAQPDYIYEAQAAVVPNDPIYNNQWSLPKISAPDAWSITTGRPEQDRVIIALADTGADINHPDFRTNLWSGTPKNFLTNPATTNVLDGNGHGSNVASIIGAQGNNGLYMTGVAWDVSLMHLKVCTNGDNNGNGLGATCPTSAIVSGINYATDNHAVAINLSLGAFHCRKFHPDPDNGKPVCEEYIVDPTLAGAVKYAKDNNVVTVCAAGNGAPPFGFGDGVNTDFDPFSPADTPYDNVISVAASQRDDTRPRFSCFGRRTVDLAAPGFQIYGLGSYNAGITYSIFSGTSMAAPHVTGAIALLKAKYPWENYLGLRDRVLLTTDPSPFGADLRTGGRLNVNNALAKRTMIRNLSTRAKVGTGNNTVIGGFIIKTDAANPDPTLKVMIRGLGPSLSASGVPGVLTNPKIRLNNSNGTQIAANDDWGNSPQSSEIANSGLAPNDSREAAIIITLRADKPVPGDSTSRFGAYTVFLESQTTQLGIGSFEIYELGGNLNERTRLVNVSTRCFVGTGNDVAIAGCQLGPSTPKRSLLIFGKGPSLANQGVQGTLLANPYIELHDSNTPSNPIISSNDNWGTGPNAAEPADELAAARIHPSSSAESELWPVLTSGKYTTILRGVNNATGIGLIEFYE